MMNTKQWTNKDKIYVYSTLKQFCLPVLEFLTIWCHSYVKLGSGMLLHVITVIFLKCWIL